MKKRSALSSVYVTLILLILYLPILVVVVYSFNTSRYGNWSGFTLDWYRQLFNNTKIMDYILNSLYVAGMSCLFAAVIGTLGALGLARSQFRGKGLLENVSILPMMIPEVVLGLAYMTIFTQVNMRFGYSTLIITHLTFCIPYILINVQSRLVGLNPSYLEAARDLGATPMRAFFDITLPLIMPAVFSGVLLAFAMSMDDVVITFFVTGTKTTTLPLYVYTMTKTGITPDINALCTVMLAIVAVFVSASQLVRRRKMNVKV